MTERLPPEDADLPEDTPVGPSVEEVWYDESEDQWHGADQYGEFRLPSGSSEPKTAEELGYDPCNAVLKHTMDRYGEKRYCKAMSGDNFNQDYSTCKQHKMRQSEGFKKAQAKFFKTGAHAKSRENVFRYIEPHKKIIANDLYNSLVAESEYDFETKTVDLEIDTSDAGFTGNVDAIALDHKIPTTHEMRCKALWYAVLDFISMQEIREAQFKTAAEDDNVDAIGERWTVVASGESGPVYDKDEHHLNLPLSRLQKDYKEHLKFGGVTIDEDTDGASEMTQREYVLEVQPEDEAEPTTKQNFGSAPIEKIDTPDE